MLLHFPTEIIIKISSFLDPDSKLYLMTTCQRLNDIIPKATLYEYLDTLNRKESTDAIIKRLKRKRINGSQVKILKTSMQDVSGKLFLELPTLFPNVVRVISAYDSRKNTAEYESDKKLFVNGGCSWIRSLEKYDTNADWKVMWPMLKKYTFSRLADLTISDWHDFKDNEGDPAIEREFDEYYLVPYLKNAPSLKKLQLTRWTVSIKLLEEIHTSCPLVQILGLDDVKFNMENDTFPQPLIPAGNVLSLSLRNTIAFDKAYLYLDYIPQKYPNLRHLYLDQKVMHQEGVRTIYLSKTGVKLLSKPHHSVDENYQKNTTQFLSRLPKSLRLLGTNIYHQDGIKVISEMNIVELDLIHSTNYIVEIEHLALLNQLRTLRTLRIGLRSCGNAFIHGLFLTHITKLVLRYSLDWLYIDWLLSLFPLLEDLDATAEGVTSGHFHVGSTYPKLKRLCIRHEVHPSFYHFMKYTVPNLEELHVNSYISRVARENGYHVDLTGWRLKRCSLIVYTSSAVKQKLNCQLTMQGISSKFTIMYPGYGVMVYSHEPAITITCDDIQHFNINSMPVNRCGDELCFPSKKNIPLNRL